MSKNKSSNFRKPAKQVWHFLWHSDSTASWIANLIVAFILIKFLVYPGLGLILGTSFPIVAVVSESMEHGLHNEVLCGQQFAKFDESFDNYWNVCGYWYEDREITKNQFKQFKFKNGFDKGDVIILWRANKKNLKLGDILIYQGSKPQPIIHRVVKSWEENGQQFYSTKGDHNQNLIPGEDKINASRIYGKGIIRVPYLGWIKILFVDLVKIFGIDIIR